jgi:hypothetical protein
MSGFCVFGMTEPLALRLARAAADKRVLTVDERKSMTEEKWEAWIADKAKDILASGNPRQVSPLFDAPQFAREWIQLAKKTAGAKRCRVMCRSEKMDKQGALVLNKKTGKPVICWVAYKEPLRLDADAESRGQTRLWEQRI